MKTVFLSIVGAGVTATSTFDYLAYLASHGKSYQTAQEFTQRHQLFLETDEKLRSQKGGHAAAHNKFSDMTQEEKLQRLGKISSRQKLELPVKPSKLQLSACTEGFFLNDGQCLQCPQGCEQCDQSGSCQVCSRGFEISALNQCISKCSVGQFENRKGKCKKCSNNCDSCTAKNQCDRCAESFQLIDNKCQCGFGHVEVNGRCECPSGMIQDGKKCLLSRTQKQCEKGFYNDGSDKCRSCAKGCEECADITGQCTKCSENLFNLDGGKGCSKCDQPILNSELGKVTHCVNEVSNNQARVVPEYTSRDDFVDWRDWGVVSAVQDQASCGSCFAFATAAAAETAFAIKTGVLHKLSEQHIIDCDQQSSGCKGGQQISAHYLLSNAGAVLSSEYPYQEKQGKCKKNISPEFQLEFPGFALISQSKQDFKRSVQLQAINVSFAVSDDFWNYSGGIYRGSECAPELNHAMVAVGYGVENGEEYAILRNSWGSDWGEEGYARVLLDNSAEGVCGLYLDNTFTTA